MKAGDELKSEVFTVSREQLVRYAGASDDYNPIHYDDQAAQSLGLPGVIVHGMLNMGLMTRFVTNQCPVGTRLIKCSVRFRQMVRPDEELEISARVKSVEGQTVLLEVRLAKIGQRSAVSGRMTVQLVK